MKIAVISDLHLGQRKYKTENNQVNRYEQKGYEVFNKFLDKILENNVDLIVNCGDTFDTPDPTALAINNYVDGFNRVKGIKTIGILGNHDFNIKNKNNGCSSLTPLNKACNITKFAEYDIEVYEQDGEIFVLAPYLYDKDDSLKDYFKKLNKVIKDCKQKPILVTHGIENTYMKKNPLIQEPFVIPNRITKNCKAVFIGHIHDSFDYMVGDTFVCSPGSLINYQAKELTTGLVIYDTKTGKMEKILIESPYLVKAVCDETNINEFLANVDELIYNIEYDGDSSVFDTDLVQSAKQKAINIKISIYKDEIEDDGIISKQTKILDWVSEKYPNKLEVFTESYNSALAE